MVTWKQKEVIEALGRFNENRHVIDDMGVSKAAVRSRLTRAYQQFMEDLELFNEYYPIFERRIKHDLNEKGQPKAYSLSRSIARKIRKSS